jgi:hypothetical protein
VIKKLTSHLLNIDSDMVFEALPSGDPVTQQQALEAKLNETIKERINTGST